MRRPGIAPMNRFCLSFLLSLVAVLAAVAAPPTPVPYIYVNDDPVAPPDVPPQIDALIFWNRSLFIVSNDFLVPPFNYNIPPYSGQSVRFWTNNGVMVGLPGFRFNYTPNPAHLTAAQRRRRGANLPQPSEVFFNNSQITASREIEISARNIFQHGLLAGDSLARIRLYATNGSADLSGSAIHTGDLPIPSCISASNFIAGPFLFGIDPAVSYIYLSSGLSGFVDTNRSPLLLPSLAGANFALPNPFPPPAQYVQTFALFPGAPATNVVTNILTSLQSCGPYDAFLHLQTNFTFATNGFGQVTTNSTRDVNVVFVPTNGLSTNITIAVAFPTNAFGTLAPIVEFRGTDFDVIRQTLVTNFVTFRNDGSTIFRGHDCEFDISDPPNAPYVGDLFYSTAFETNIADYTYTVAYAQVGNTNSIYFTNAASQFLVTPELGRSPAASDPTNFAGAVHINAQNLNLNHARIRGENGVYIRTTNLISSDLAFIDAPFSTFDVATTNSSLVISNFIRPQIDRLQATFNSWAAQWTAVETNSFATNLVIGTNGVVITNITGTVGAVSYRVLILGACVDSIHPAIVHRLAVRAPNIVVEDNLMINAGLRLEGDSLRLGSNASIALPRGHNLAFTNLIGITSFTNEGVVNVPDGAFFGAFEDGYVQPPLTRKQQRQLRRGKLSLPRLETYESFVNHDTVRAASVSVRAGYIEDFGLPFMPTLITATNGPARFEGATVILSNAEVTAMSDIRINAGSLFAARTRLEAGATNAGIFTNTYIPGALVINATNSFTDGGLSQSNLWLTTSGVRIEQYPVPLTEEDVVGDLMGTHIVSRAGIFSRALHVWPAEDRGATVEGFANNLAVGQLTLDASLGNDFRFQSATFSNALYVDYLELVRDATNYNLTLNVAPDFTIYFGDANISPEKIEEVSGGRVRWVFQFTGPRSSTNITYPNGFTYTFNAGVVRSRDRDDDNDGVVNQEDCTPLPVPDFDSTQPCPMADARPKALATSELGLTIAIAPGGGVVLSWDAPAGSANTVEFTDSLSSGRWEVLTNFSNGPENARVTVRDAVAAPLRVYRVRVDAGKP